MFFKGSHFSPGFVFVLLFSALNFVSNARASEPFQHYDVVIGPTFSSSNNRNYGLSAGIKKREYEDRRLGWGAFLAVYSGNDTFGTADMTVGIILDPFNSLYAGVGARFGSSENAAVQFTLGAAIGYVSASLRRYNTSRGPASEGVLSFNIPVRVFL